MYKVLAIISEYNPFHLGHLYHLNESKKKVKPDYTIAIMSGNYMQRGEPAMFDKWTRTEIAINNGVDLVIELPLFYSISSAENFAAGAIKILKNLKMQTYLSFGSECGDITILDEISDVLINEPPEYKSMLKNRLDSGDSFPKAREKSLLMYLNNIRRFANVLSEPNNILGIEYIKAIKLQKAKIDALTIKREGSIHNNLILDGKFASGSAIRHAISANDEEFKKYLPKASYKLLKEKIDKNEFVYGLSDYEQAIIYKLRTMSTDEIKMLPDVSEGLENKIKKAAETCGTMDELINKIKSKRYTQTRINRILLYALLGITKQDIEDFFKVGPYIRVLGVNEKGKELISILSKKNKKLNIITSPKRFINRNKNKILKNILEKENLATNIYTLGYKKNVISNLDYTNKLITL